MRIHHCGIDVSRARRRSWDWIRIWRRYKAIMLGWWEEGEERKRSRHMCSVPAAAGTTKPVDAAAAANSASPVSFSKVRPLSLFPHHFSCSRLVFWPMLWIDDCLEVVAKDWIFFTVSFPHICIVLSLLCGVQMDTNSWTLLLFSTFGDLFYDSSYLFICGVCWNSLFHEFGCSLSRPQFDGTRLRCRR